MSQEHVGTLIDIRGVKGALATASCSVEPAAWEVRSQPGASGRFKLVDPTDSGLMGPRMRSEGFPFYI